MAPHGVYPCAGDDRWIALVGAEEAAWAGLLSVAGDEEPSLLDPRFATLRGRLECQDELDAAIAGWTRGRDGFELAEALQAAGVAAAPVMDPPSLLVDENFTALRAACTRMDTDAGLAVDQIYDSIPWKLTETPGAVRLPLPGLGEHNDEVYKGLLGLGSDELAGLRERGVI
jgi:benzylsuccinate CoA-transferase BbsF subunit